jgi:hypothetical protein
MIEKWRVDYNTKGCTKRSATPPAPAACNLWGANSSSQSMTMI